MEGEPDGTPKDQSRIGRDIGRVGSNSSRTQATSDFGPRCRTEFELLSQEEEDDESEHFRGFVVKLFQWDFKIKTHETHQH